MRLRLFDRLRRMARFRRSPAYETGVPGVQGRHRRVRREFPEPPHLGPDGQPPVPRDGQRPAAPAPAASGPPAGNWQPRHPARPGGLPADLTHSAPRTGPPSSVRAGTAQARIRERPPEAAPHPAVAAPQASWAGPGQASLASAPAAELTAVVTGIPRQSAGPGASARRAAGGRELPLTYPEARDRPGPGLADGRRHCGSLEKILWRQWDPEASPPREVTAAVDRLAELPERIKERLAAGLDAIFIGPGGVPDLDDMTSLRGVPLPAGRATWDACAGAYGERKIVVGSRPSPTPDVMCHEVGHALDDLDGPSGQWQSDSAEFRTLYEQCQPHLASDFHRQPGGLGRKEFFADAFAAIASRQRPALVDMLGGNTRTALHVMLYFSRRYGI
jgi:hypothetical protein